VHLGISRCTGGYQRHHRRTFCDCVRSQGAPVERLHKPLVDWRTFARLQMFNDIANKRFKAAGLPIFPEWNMAVPFLMAPVADAAHWHESMPMQHLGPLCPYPAGARGRAGAQAAGASCASCRSGCF
jgi:hypothetical protein